MQGITSPTWHVGANTFIIRFYQSPGKPARLSLKVHEAGLVNTVYAFDSQGTITSSAFQPPQPEYIDFEPPPYPGDPDVPPTEEPLGEGMETPPDVPVTPPFDFEWPDIGQWWDNLVTNVQDRIDQWWQDFTKDLQERIEQELLRMLQEALDSLARQCSGNAILVLAVGVGAIARKRYRR
jgi:hypothetical protein